MASESKSIPGFQDMWDAFPQGSADAVKSQIGGSVNQGWLTDTSIVSLCHAFNTGGEAIPKALQFADASPPKKLNTTSGPSRDDGPAWRYAFRAAEFLKYLRETFGEPDLKESGGAVPASFGSRKGVVVFLDCGWTHAPAHIDLWNGTQCAGAGYFSEAKDLLLWECKSIWKPEEATAEEGGVVLSLTLPT
ncbi:type VI secretion system amidase effector protein Tae4 [Planctomycetota bacterium]|nr:type VI secretion system amidase effector protein Tae4 [Planctomycetota bacterium]